MRNAQRGESALELVLTLVALGVVYGIALIFAASISPERAVRTMEAQGYSEVHVIDKNILFVGWRGCSGGDAARFIVTGKNSAGKSTQVYVCAGYFKGGTIRVD